ncbi:MAG: hypothetical protein RBR43_00960 [Desulfuromonadaceae bacterium]|nr:hypothetical protein [Desulfuromonas sp.]MDY0184432.1 hypothetical protein [Desulfuromonadaceae bacterium]
MRYTQVIITLLIYCCTFPLSASAAVWISQWRAPDPQSGVRLESVLAMVFDPQRERIYVADGLAGKLHAFDLDGQHLSDFDAGGDLGTPVSITLQRTGRFWFVDRKANALVRLVPEEQRLERFPFSLTGAEAMLPEKVVWHPEAGLMVLDRLSGNVLALDDNLNVRGRYGSNCIDVVSAAGKLWILQADASVVQVDPSDASESKGKRIALQYDLKRPSALERSPQGQLFIADRGLCQVLVFSPAGRHLYSIGARGNRLGRFSAPRQILFLDSAQGSGALAVLDEVNRCVDLFRR